MNNNVEQAARALISPTTDHATRALASQFLEDWMGTEQAWAGVLEWLQQALQQQQQQQQQEVAMRISMTLLCLQLLQSKIRREVPIEQHRHHHNPGSSLPPSLASALLSTLAHLIQVFQGSSDNSNSAVVSSACIAMAALSVRCGQINELFAMCTSSLLQQPDNNNNNTHIHMFSPLVSLKLLSHVPLELSECALTTSHVTSALTPFVEELLDTVRHALLAATSVSIAEAGNNSNNDSNNNTRIQVAALEALYSWTKTCHISLSVWNNHQHLNHQNNPAARAAGTTTTATVLVGSNNNKEPILPLIAQLLSSNNPSFINESVLVPACRALTEAIQLPTDACTPTRAAACRLLLTTPGFVAAPLELAARGARDMTAINTATNTANGIGGDNDHDFDDANDDIDGCWEDACHALATLLATLVCEQVDDLVGIDHDATSSHNTNDNQQQQHAMMMMQQQQQQQQQQATNNSLQALLLRMQQHPLLKVRMTMLDVWLTIQDVPTSQRHEAWKKPLFGHVLNGLLQSCLYPADYDNSSSNGWAESVTDESEWNEYRRMVMDVLVSTYFLLRSEYVERCVSLIINNESNHNNTGAGGDTSTNNNNQHHHYDWRVTESALFALTATAREVCARIKSGCGSSSSTNAAGAAPPPKGLLATDRDRTGQALLHLVHHLLFFGGGLQSGGGGAPSSPEMAVRSLASRHVHVLAATIDFVGAFAPAWETLPLCTPEAALQLLTLLLHSLSIREVSVRAAKSIRSLLIGCSTKLLSSSSTSTTGDAASTRIGLLALFQQLLESSVANPEHETLSTILEGCTRLLVQVKDDEAMVRQGFVKLVEPLLQSGDAALQVLLHHQNIGNNSNMNNHSEASVAALESLGRYLRGLQVIIRFCDSANSANNGVMIPMSEILNAVWNFLEKVSQHVLATRATAGGGGGGGGVDGRGAFSHHEVVVLDQVLGIHEQLLKTVPMLMAPHFERTIHQVVGIFERSKQPSTLAYLSRAVEVYGASNVDSFRELLTHVAAEVFAFISQGKPVSEATELLASFFELNQRYVLYCPAALVASSQFPSIVACAVECITACQGERESTRATLNFLTQLFAWRNLRIATASQAQLQSVSQSIDELLFQLGGTVTVKCMQTLVGGPQMLWPVCTDCLFAVLSSPVAGMAATPDDDSMTVGRQWLEAARPHIIRSSNRNNGGGASSSYSGADDDGVYSQVVSIFFNLIVEGSKNKPKARMLLTDFCKIQKGEMTVDALIAYSLP